MELDEKPSRRTPRSIPPELHDTVWKLHGEGLGSPQIAERLVSSGCVASRHSVRRLVIRLERIERCAAWSEKIAEEVKLARASSLTLRQIHEEELSDVCDDLSIAVRKDQHDRVMSLSRTGRVLLRTVDHYDRMYLAAVKRESELPVPEPMRGVPQSAPMTVASDERAELAAAEAKGLPCSPVTEHTIACRVTGARATKSAVRLAAVGCLLFLLLLDLPCRLRATTEVIEIARNSKPETPVKKLLTPAQMRASTFTPPSRARQPFCPACA